MLRWGFTALEASVREARRRQEAERVTALAALKACEWLVFVFVFVFVFVLCFCVAAASIDQARLASAPSHTNAKQEISNFDHAITPTPSSCVGAGMRRVLQSWSDTAKFRVGLVRLASKVRRGRKQLLKRRATLHWSLLGAGRYARCNALRSGVGVGLRSGVGVGLRSGPGACWFRSLRPLWCWCSLLWRWCRPLRRGTRGDTDWTGLVCRLEGGKG